MKRDDELDTTRAEDENAARTGYWAQVVVVEFLSAELGKHDGRIGLRQSAAAADLYNAVGTHACSEALKETFAGGKRLVSLLNAGPRTLDTAVASAAALELISCNPLLLRGRRSYEGHKKQEMRNVSGGCS